jgi:hypothetical protein
MLENSKEMFTRRVANTVRHIIRELDTILSLQNQYDNSFKEESTELGELGEGKLIPKISVNAEEILYKGIKASEVDDAMTVLVDLHSYLTDNEIYTKLYKLI